MAEEPVAIPRTAATSVTGAAATPAARQQTGLTTQTRNRALFGLFVAFLVLYPLLDRTLGFGRMGSLNPMLIFMLLALGLNIVVGFAGLLDLGYAAFFAIGGYTVAFLTAPQSPLVKAGIETDFWLPCRSRLSCRRSSGSSSAPRRCACAVITWRS